MKIIQFLARLTHPTGIADTFSVHTKYLQNLTIVTGF
jgi:hypothetical protein